MKKLAFLTLLFFAPYFLFAQIEKVDIDGAVRVGAHEQTPPTAGTIEWDGTHFRGYDGTTWKILDFDGVSSGLTSLVSAWLSYDQRIPNDQWTPVQFDMVEYDLRGEFTPAPIYPDPAMGAIINEQAFFTAMDTGYYQVNARAEFDLDTLSQLEPDILNFKSFVSIAIVISDSIPFPDDPYAGASLGVMEAQGNNLQIAIDALGGVDGPDGIGEPLLRNNAPNISDVIYMNAGQHLSIWVLWYAGLVSPGPAFYFIPLQAFHKVSGPAGDESPTPELVGPPPFVPHKSKVYVSIHKVN